MRRLLRPFLILLALVFLFEAWLWRHLAPIVGWVEPPFDLNPDPFEVADVFEAPLEFFLDPVNHQRHSDVFNGRKRHFYSMAYGDRYIWGATAAMLMILDRTLRD